MLGLGGGELCLPDFGTETLPFNKAFCLGEFATRSGLWKNHLGSCDDEQGQKDLEAGLRLLQLSKSDW